MKEIIMIIIITSMMMKMMMTLTKLNILQKAEAELEAADPPPLLVLLCVEIELLGTDRRDSVCFFARSQRWRGALLTSSSSSICNNPNTFPTGRSRLDP